VPLLGIGDLHAGSKGYDNNKITEIINWIKANKAWWIGVGDLIECAIKSSPGASQQDQVLPNQEQYDHVLDLLDPIKDRCLGLIKGNHEERSFKTVGLDPMMMMARDLEVHYLGWEFFGVLMVTTKPVGWSIYACHTSTANKTAGLALNWTEANLMRWMDCDIIMKAHGHDMGFDIKERIEVNKQKLSVAIHNRYLVLTGHYVNRPNTYLASRGASPKPKGTVALWLGSHAVRPEYIM
jgi:hypothetical protein